MYPFVIHVVRPGTVLTNANAAVQDMVLVRVRGTPAGQFLKAVAELRFESSVEREYVFDAYCLDVDKGNPSEHDRFTIAGPAPEPILRIVQVPGSDVEARQLAIWAITNDISAADATDSVGATDADIGSARRMLLAAGIAADRYRLFADR